MARKTAKYGSEPGTEAYDMAYARDQFVRRTRDGLGASVLGLDVLEIGCGHGGISCFIACAGAKSVVGIDLNTRSMSYAVRLASELGANFGGTLPVTFREMDAYHLEFAPETFDMVVAENSFEHFLDPEEVMRQSWRVLRKGGVLLVPIFSSIYSKYGLHLKHGLKLPWANLLFSEQTIIRAMHRLAKERPELMDLYPGLRNSPSRVRDLRAHGDLNDITYKRFAQMAARVGFDVRNFRYFPTRVGRVMQRIWPLGRSFLMDVFSTGASAHLVKP
jgi:ubiquinone/menaquinone biosynthesis C-methylase UbiE